MLEFTIDTLMDMEPAHICCVIDLIEHTLEQARRKHGLDNEFLINLLRELVMYKKWAATMTAIEEKMELLEMDKPSPPTTPTHGQSITIQEELSQDPEEETSAELEDWLYDVQESIGIHLLGTLARMKACGLVE